MSAASPFAIHALELGPMENFVYLVEDRASGRAAVVDPAWEVPEVLALANNEGLFERLQGYSRDEFKDWLDGIDRQGSVT